MFRVAHLRNELWAATEFAGQRALGFNHSPEWRDRLNGRPVTVIGKCGLGDDAQENPGAERAGEVRLGTCREAIAKFRDSDGSPLAESTNPSIDIAWRADQHEFAWAVAGKALVKRFHNSVLWMIEFLFPGARPTQDRASGLLCRLSPESA